MKNKIKKFIIITSMIIASFIVIGEPEKISYKIAIIKILSMLWIWLVCKANNYFYKGE